jgi:MFS family permease
MIGYVLASVIFAKLADVIPPGVVMSVGLGTWTIGAFGTALAPNYTILVFWRMFVGVGEASFVCLAPTYIDDYSPAGRRTLWLSIFYAAVYIGYAAGFAVGGFFTALCPQCWRGAFIFEAVCMGPFIITALGIPDIKRSASGLLPEDNTEEDQLFVAAKMKMAATKHRKRSASARAGLRVSSVDSHTLNRGEEDADQVQEVQEDQEDQEDEDEAEDDIPAVVVLPVVGLLTALYRLLSNAVFLTSVMGFAAATFVAGALAFWGPAFMTKVLHMNLPVTGVAIAVITVFTGLVGTVFGGALVDWLGGTQGRGGVRRGMLMSSLFTLCSFPFFLLAFFTSYTPLFCLFLGMGEFLIFAVTAPVYGAQLSSCPPALRNYSMALSNLMMHLFGDVPSPAVVGLVATLTGSLRDGMLFLGIWMVLAVGCWLLSWALTFRRSFVGFPSEEDIAAEKERRREEKEKEKEKKKHAKKEQEALV